MSYTATDEPWAEWIAATLREAGHDVSLQATDFLPGENFVIRMQAAATAADHTIVVLSSRYLSSRFGAAEWAAAFAADPTGSDRALIPVAIEPISPPGLWRAIVRIDLFGKPEAHARQALLSAVRPERRIRVPFPAPGDGPPGGAPGGTAGLPPGRPAAVEVWRLPTSDGLLIGRAAELEQLDSCWAGTTNLVTIVGWGGSGKTTLLNHWLATMAARRYLGADRVFAWSFDSQAAGGQVNTSDQFIDGALSFFGATGLSTTSVWERCRTLATHIQQCRALVILDGIDRLQEPPGRSGGTLREPAMRMLVRDLAAYNTGLCVITSRLPLADVRSFVGHTTTSVQLGSLSVADASRVLVEEGVRGDAEETGKTAVEARCHPLTLRLLGSFIRTVYDGELRRWQASGLAHALEEAGENTAGRIMDEYGSWFDGRPESQILTAVGLFDRPASDGELAALRAAPVVPGLNNLLMDTTEVQWAYALRNLAASGLVTVRSGPRTAGPPGPVDRSIDAHPLVRGHFGTALRRLAPEAFREGHRRLCAYLSTNAPDKPATLAESLPLISAVLHGTRAGLTGAMAREIYWPRLAQDSHQLRDVLGAAAANHEVLSYIVTGDHIVIGDEPDSTLSQLELAQVLCDQALDLRMLGRPHDAIAPLRQATEVAARAGDEAVIANALRHLAQLHLTLGQFADARDAASAAARHAAGLPPAHLEAIATQLTLADVEGHLGNAEAARRIVRAVLPRFTEDLTARHAHRATLYISAFRAVEISLSAADAVTGERPRASPGIRRLHGLTRRLRDLNDTNRRLSLPRAVMRLAAVLIAARSSLPGPTTTAAIDSAVAEIRESGQRPWLVHALLIRAAVFRQLGAFETAETSLNEAKSLCAADGMVTRQLDCDMEAARNEIARGNGWQGRILLESLATAAARLGYQRLCGQVGAPDPAGRAPGHPELPGQRVDLDVQDDRIGR